MSLIESSQLRGRLNPTNNEITIECEQFQDGINYSCEITNITGKTIKQVYIKNRSQIIDVDKMITGMYFIKINYGSKVFSAKIIKL